MKFNIYFVLGVVLIAVDVGIGMGTIGRVPESCGPYPWWLSIEIFLLVSLPFFLGYLGGKYDQ